MGALTPDELDVALAAGSEVAVWRDGFRELAQRPWPSPGSAGSRPRQVRQRHGPARQPRTRRGAGARPRLRRGPATRAGRGLDALRDRRRTGLRLLRRRSSSVSRLSPTRSGREFPGVTVHAANSAAVFREPRVALRHGPLRGRDLRPRPVPGGPGRARPRAGDVAALLRRRREALRGRRQRRLRPDLAGAGADTWVGVLPIGYGDGVRRGLSNNAEVLVGGRRHSAGRHRLDGQRDDRPRARDRRRARRRGGADRRPGRGARSLPRRSLGASGTINYEVTCGISARVPREHA